VDSDAKVVAETLEVLVEMQNVHARALSGRGNREVGEGIAMCTVGTGGGQLTHRCPSGHRASTISS
jgi:hypothetical protein